jgi:hypothetical protein
VDGIEYIYNNKKMDYGIIEKKTRKGEMKGLKREWIKATEILANEKGRPTYL